MVILIEVIGSLLAISFYLFFYFQGTKYGWYFNKMGLDEVVDTYDGEGITIAFLDTGLYKAIREAYGNRIVSPVNLLDNSTNIEDKGGHGTKVITLATGNNNEIDYYGIASKSKIMPIVVTDSSGITSPALISEGIYYAVNNGANIINISIELQLDNNIVKEACNFAYVHKVLVISSVGDSRSGVSYPAKYTNVLGVQAQKANGEVYQKVTSSQYFNYLIPGVDLFTCTNKINNYFLSSGSGYSVAIFSGICALLLQKNNNFDVVYELLFSYSSISVFLNVPTLLKLV
jgi:hypothetical protein